MNTDGGRDRLVTPEAVSLDLETAGIGSRVAGALVDGAIQAAILAAGLIAGALNPAFGEGFWLVVVGIIFFTLVLYGYHGIFEGLWEGRTPGKVAAGTRVVSDRGQPVTWRQVLIRSIFRLIDFSPIGALAIIFTRRSQRLGDLAAATIVVRDQRQPAPAALVFAPDGRREVLARSMDVSAVSPEEYALVRSFLQRRTSLSGPARSKLAAQLRSSLEAKAGKAGGPIEPETYLEAVVVAVRERAGGANGILS